MHSHISGFFSWVASTWSGLTPYEQWSTFQWMGVIAIATLGLWAAMRRAKAMEKNVEQAMEGNRILAKRQDDERYAKHLELLGGDVLVSALGAVFGLHYLARDKGDYRLSVAEVFCAFVRAENSIRDTRSEVILAIIRQPFDLRRIAALQFQEGGFSRQR